MERTFLQLTTEDVSNPFYNAKVEVKEENDETYTVADILTGNRLTFKKRDDPIVTKFVSIEDPTRVSETE
jgi:hypothetical protein